MNSKKSTDEGDYRSLLILDEISKNEELTQLELSKRLDIAVGLVNSYIKNLANKGYIAVSAIPKRRYLYYLTPKGFVAQSRLTYQHLQNFTSLYRVARRDFGAFFQSVKNDSELNRIAFCGVDEITEIAYLSLYEVGLELKAVIDDKRAGKDFFGHTIIPLEAVTAECFDMVVITSFKDGHELAARLVGVGLKEEIIYDISRGGWLGKVAASAEGAGVESGVGGA